MYCTGCGEPIPDASQFCIHCGIEVSEDARLAAASAPAAGSGPPTGGEETPVPVGPSQSVQGVSAPARLPSGNDPQVLERLGWWNWGAFLLTPFWLGAHRLWGFLVGWLLASIFLLNLPASIFVGVLGNRLAWQYRPFSGLDEFRSVQRIWALAGALAVAVCLAGLTALVFLAALIES